MRDELTAKEAFKILSEVCEENPNNCSECPIFEITRDGNCVSNLTEYEDEILETLKRIKESHEKFETEWVHICRVIEDIGGKRQCVCEKEIKEDDILPFGTRDDVAEAVLKEYCKSHKGNFFATVERICRKVVM